MRLCCCFILRQAEACVHKWVRLARLVNVQADVLRIKLYAACVCYVCVHCCRNWKLWSINEAGLVSTSAQLDAAADNITTLVSTTTKYYTGCSYGSCDARCHHRTVCYIWSAHATVTANRSAM
jgi:hypothetical protein